MRKGAARPVPADQAVGPINESCVRTIGGSRGNRPRRPFLEGCPDGQPFLMARRRALSHPALRGGSDRSPVPRRARPRLLLYSHHSRAIANAVTRRNVGGMNGTPKANMRFRSGAMRPPYSGRSQIATPWTTPNDATVATI